MKTYKETLSSVLGKAEAYKAAQAKKRSAFLKVGISAGAFAVFAAIGVAAFSSGIFNDPVTVVPGSEPTDSTVGDAVTSAQSGTAPSDTATSDPFTSDPFTSDPFTSDPVTGEPASSVSDPVSGTVDPVKPVVSSKLGANFNNATLYFNSAGSGQASDGLVYALNDDGESYCVYSGKCSDEVITIPETYNGIPVTAIGADAFAHSDNLVSVEIPETVTVIATSAFASCPNLETVYYLGSNSLWSYVDTAWEPYLVPYSDGLDLVYEAGRKEGEPDCYWCMGIGTCTDANIVVPGEYKGLPVYVASSFLNDNQNVVSVTFGEGITYLQMNVIQNCGKLESIILPSTLTHLEENAFLLTNKNGWKRAHVAFAGTQEQWDAIMSEMVIRHTASSYPWAEFTPCIGVDHLSVKHGHPTCSEFGYDYYTCQKCAYYYTIGHDDEPALGHSFENGICTRCGASDGSDPSAELPWVYEIDSGKVTLLAYTGSNTVVTVPATIENFPVTNISISNRNASEYHNSSLIEELILPVGIDTIESVNACTSLRKINIPDGVTSIGTSAFYGLPVEEIYLPDSMTFIGAQAFRDCLSLTTFRMSDNVTVIESNAFCNCQSLKSITLPSKLKTLEGAAFKNCHLITDVTIPGTVRVIGDHCFEYCYALESVTIGDGVERIMSFAFSSCRSLTEIDIPKSVKQIEYYSFSGCTNLKIVTVRGNANHTNDTRHYSSIFGSSTSVETARIDPSDATSSVVWALHRNGMLPNIKHLYILDGAKCIPAVFSDFENLESLYIPLSVETIDNKSFEEMGDHEGLQVYYEGTQEQADALRAGLDAEHILNNCTWHYNQTW